MPNYRSRTVRPVQTPNTPCEWTHGPLKCMTERPAVHITLASTWTIPAGTAVCGFHSPEDVLYRWEVKITPDVGTHGRVIDTFTWARDRTSAYTRVTAMMDDGMWDGYSFNLSDAPTPNLHA